VKVCCRQTKPPKTVRAEACVGIPEVIAGQVDVLPADRREMGEQRIRNRLALPAQKIKRPAEIHRVPERDGGGDEGQPTGPILPCRDSAIAQAAKAVEADGTGKRVARFALVQLNRGLAPEFRHLQPVQSEQCSLDAADFAQGQRQPVLPWVSTKPLEEERSAGRPGAHRYRQAQDILPVSHDQLFVDAAGDERREYWPRAGRPEGVEPAIGTLTA